MKHEHDILVYAGLLVIIVAIALAAVVLRNTNDTSDLESKKIRFAAAIFTGILMLFIFTAILYFSDTRNGVGKDIFEKAIISMSPIAGAIVGYFFASRTQGRSAPKNPAQAIAAHHPGLARRGRIRTHRRRDRSWPISHS